MREGERCEPRELCCDFLDGGSIILNKLDLHWPPIGRLCAALRSHFLHVFAVMYLTPRNSRAVPAHSDDQDVFIVQLAGRKSWTVYGSPIELPYSHEQLGKSGAPLDPAQLGPPLLTAELQPGSVLYLPRGYVHEARATASGCSLHVTLTVQTSDLNWRTFVRDGLYALHRATDVTRLPLPLEPSAGGYEGSLEPATSAMASEAVHQGVYSGAVDVSEGEAAACAGAGASAEAPTVTAARMPSVVSELLAGTAAEADRAFELAMEVLTQKLGALNGKQDAALAAEEAAAALAGQTQRRRGMLPPLLRCPPGVSMAVRALPGGPDGPARVELKCARADGSMTTTHAPYFAGALTFMAARNGVAFAPTDLPESDAHEQVALCSRLLGLGALCPHEAESNSLE